MYNLQARWTVPQTGHDPQSSSGITGENDRYTGWKLWREMVTTLTMIVSVRSHWSYRYVLTHPLCSSPHSGHCGCPQCRWWLFLWGAVVSHMPGRSVYEEGFPSRHVWHCFCHYLCVSYSKARYWNSLNRRTPALLRWCGSSVKLASWLI